MVLGDGLQMVGSVQRAEGGLWDLVLGVTWLPPRGAGSGAAGNAAVSALAISVRRECKAALGCLGAGSKMVPTYVCGYFWGVKRQKAARVREPSVCSPASSSHSGQAPRGMLRRVTPPREAPFFR